MPGILSRSSAGNLNGYKFKTVLGLSPLQSQTVSSGHSANASPYDAEHEEDDTDTQRAHNNSNNNRKSAAKPPRGRKLRARIPEEQRQALMPPAADAKASRAARPVRMDAQDGLWSVSVAEASPRSFTIYVKSLSCIPN